MVYSLKDLADIKTKAIHYIIDEIDKANIIGNVEEILKKYGISLNDDFPPIDIKKGKILVLGALAGKLQDYQKIAKEMNISKEHIEFINDYSKLTNFNASRLRYSSIYSDIIYGPNPHKQVSIGEFNSLLSLMKAKSNEYPNVIEAFDSNGLKISISIFKKCLLMTRLYSIINS